MRRLLRPTAALILTLALAASGAVAREHDGGDHGRGGESGQERSQDRGPPPGWSRGGGERGRERGGGPPPWSRGGAGPGGRWERGPEAYGPPVGAYPAPGPGPYRALRPGPNRARRGGYLPPEARGGVVQDYGRYRLRQPPRGYAWVRSGQAMMLMDMNTGQVFDVIPD